MDLEGGDSFGVCQLLFVEKCGLFYPVLFIGIVTIIIIIIRWVCSDV